ncbi:hypothetical protein [Roseovarius sp. 217]|uniref:hypothetical protein n=1 Tax=Roseovarius sp. (strain 217) TaxID=314264 RepID=UPI0000687464|nr:hypothetical protein [Roseovarius sp. 217]EAQ24940.1 hypothetical protein ROS217_17092 [Roseovarius sp. 217]
MRIRPALVTLPLIASLIAGCSDLLPLDAALRNGTRGAAYPDLIPAEQITDRGTTNRITPETAPDLDQRSAGLRARAQRLKGGVVDPTTQSRMQSGVTN